MTKKKTLKTAIQHSYLEQRLPIERLIQELAHVTHGLTRQGDQEVTGERVVDHGEGAIHGREELHQLVHVRAVLDGVAETPLLLQPGGVVGGFREVPEINQFCLLIQSFCVS